MRGVVRVNGRAAGVTNFSYQQESQGRVVVRVGSGSIYCGEYDVIEAETYAKRTRLGVRGYCKLRPEARRPAFVVFELVPNTGGRLAQVWRALRFWSIRFRKSRPLNYNGPDSVKKSD